MRFPALPVLSHRDTTQNFEKLRQAAVEVPKGAMTAQTRVAGTAYQPSAEHPAFVIVTSKLLAANDELRVLMDAVNPPTTIIARSISQSVGNVFVPITFLVPVAFYYKFEAIGTAAIDRTYEYTL